MCSWESLLRYLLRLIPKVQDVQLTIYSTASIALTNGGYAGLIYTWLIAWLGFIAVYASMAEMASVAPTTGGNLPHSKLSDLGSLC